MSKEMIEKSNETKKLKINSEFIFDILITICLIIFAIAISPKELQNDTFYTIKCGEYVFNNGIFNLKSDPFSWLDLPYTFPHWLYDLSMYIIYAKFGLDGIYISTIVLSSILGLGLYNLSLYKSKNRIVSGVISILALYLMKPYITARAQLVTYILFVLELLFLEKFLNNKKLLYAMGLVIIAGLIAELHVAVYPMFFIFLLPAIGEFFMSYILNFISFIDLFFKKLINNIIIKLSKNENKINKCQSNLIQIKQENSIRQIKLSRINENPYKVKIEKNKTVLILILIFIISGLTGLLNPVGNTPYTYLLKTYQGDTTQSINEHLPVTLADTPEFAISICIFLLLLTFMDLKISFRDLLMLCGVIFMAFKSRRQMTMFVIAGAPIMCKLISDFFEKYDKKTCEKLLKYSTSIIGVVVILFGFGFGGYKVYNKKIDESYINSSDYPVDAANWINENLDVSKLKLYNEYNYGSYLIYRNIPVFIDSRADLYAPEFNNVEGYANAGDDIFNDALDIPSLSRGYEKIFEKYGVNHVILYSNAKLALLLDEDEGYKELYDDGNFKIYERLKVSNE